MEKFTPGPWHIGREQDHSADRWKRNEEWSKIRGIDNGLITTIESVHPKGKRQSMDFDIEAANAQLISAAPDMLQALKFLLSSYKADFKNITGGELNETDAVKKACEVIRKATGE